MRTRWIAAGLALTGLAATAVLVTATTAVTAQTHPTQQSDRRGELVTAQPLRTLSTPQQVAAELASDQFKTASVRHGVDTYQLVYRTVDAAGRPTVASGLLALPRNGARQLSTVSYAHGTEINRLDAPSLWPDVWIAAPAITYASAGFAAVAPDYLGLGLGPGRHPYLDVASATTAELDLLRAARAFAPSTGRVLGPRVYVTGFSQGATAALGLARALQDGADGRFRVAAVAPVSGAYEWDLLIPAILDGQVPEPWGVVYTAYLLTSWNRLHHIYDEPDEVFATKYADKVDALFDGLHSGEDIIGDLPSGVTELLTPYGVQLMREPTGALAAAVREYESSCTGWTPRVPVRLFVSGGDEQLPAANSRHCAAVLRARGGTAEVVDVGDMTYRDSRHLGSNILATAATARWFTTVDGR